MQYQICENCGNQLTKEDRFCGFCGTQVEITDVKGEPTIPAPSSRPSSPKRTTNLSAIPPTQPALRQRKLTQRKSTQRSDIAKRTSNNKKKSNLFLNTFNWAIHHPKFRPTITIIVVILVSYLFLKNYNDQRAYLDSPRYGLQSYCDALKGVPNYDTAYSSLSSRDTGRSSITKSDFMVREKQITDPQHGIGDCAVNVRDQFGDIAHGTITYTYGNGKQSTQEYEVFRAGYQSWKIETNGWQPTKAPVA